MSGLNVIPNSSMRRLFLYKPIVRLGAAVAVELPHVAHLANLIEVQIRDYKLVRITGRLRDYLAARVAEVALPIELADVPGLLVSHSVDRADEITICHCVRRLLELPQILRQPRYCGRRVEDYLRAVQSERPRAFGKVAIITDVDADTGERSFERGIAEVSRFEVVL